DRLQGAVTFISHARLAAGKARARLDRAALIHKALLLVGFDRVAAFRRGDEQEIELRIVGAGRPVLAAGNGRALPARRIGARTAHAIGLHILGWIVVERLAGLRVEAGRPGQLVDILLAGHERPVVAIKRIIEAVAGGVDDQLAILAVDLGVDDRVLGDLIVVVGIVGCVLETPFDLAIGRVDRKHARGPLVVAGSIFRIIVGAGIADALVERVALRIIGGGLPD